MATVVLVPAARFGFAEIGATYAMGGADAGWLPCIAYVPTAVILLIWVGIYVSMSGKRQRRE